VRTNLIWNNLFIFNELFFVPTIKILLAILQDFYFE